MSDVPHLRFPEFTEGWEEHKLCHIASIVGRIGFRGYTTNDIVAKGEGAIALSPTNIENNKLTYDKDNTYISFYKYEESPAIMIKKGDVIFVKTGSTVGKVAYVDKLICKTTLNPQVVVLKNIQCNSYLLSVLLSTNRFQNAIKKITVGGAVPTLSQAAMGNIAVIMPKVAEQEKLSKFISLLDERIATQNKIIEDLKLLRDAISDAMFCTPKQSAPRKRIKGFYSDWQKVHLKDICSRVRQKNTNGRCDLVLTIAAKYGLVSQLDFFNKSVASENLEGYYLLQKGYFAYNKSYSSEYTCGAVKRLERYEEGVLSPLYICFRPDPSKVNSDYLSYYFESTKWYREIMDISVEGARNHGLLNISVVDYFNTIHRIPNMDEQKCIANVIKAIMHKISSEQTILDCYVKQRIFLLRQMFI